MNYALQILRRQEADHRSVAQTLMARTSQERYRFLVEDLVEQARQHTSQADQLASAIALLEAHEVRA